MSVDDPPQNSAVGRIEEWCTQVMPGSPETTPPVETGDRVEDYDMPGSPQTTASVDTRNADIGAAYANPEETAQEKAAREAAEHKAEQYEIICSRLEDEEARDWQPHVWPCDEEAWNEHIEIIECSFTRYAVYRCVLLQGKYFRLSHRAAIMTTSRSATMTAVKRKVADRIRPASRGCERWDFDHSSEPFIMSLNSFCFLISLLTGLGNFFSLIQLSEVEAMAL